MHVQKPASVDQPGSHTEKIIICTLLSQWINWLGSVKTTCYIHSQHGCCPDSNYMTNQFKINQLSHQACWSIVMARIHCTPVIDVHWHPHNMLLLNIATQLSQPCSLIFNVQCSCTDVIQEKYRPLCLNICVAPKVTWGLDRCYPVEGRVQSLDWTKVMDWTGLDLHAIFKNNVFIDLDYLQNAHKTLMCFKYNIGKLLYNFWLSESTNTLNRNIYTQLYKQGPAT